MIYAVECTFVNHKCFLQISAVKAKNVVTLNVDGVYMMPGIGAAGVSSTDTNDPLHIGGVPGKSCCTSYSGFLPGHVWTMLRKSC
jgi:hypothetical protein